MTRIACFKFNEIKEIYKKNDLFINAFPIKIFAKKNDIIKITIIIRKKIGHAPFRNRIRRIIHEFIRKLNKNNKINYKILIDIPIYNKIVDKINFEKKIYNSLKKFQDKIYNEMRISGIT